MINLTTDCEKCVHKTVCKNRDHAKNDMEKLKNATYGDGPNDDYDWEIMMKSRHVNIQFSCPDYRPDYGNIHVEKNLKKSISNKEKIFAC